jgi:putative hydrolase of the HAD superfamily
MAGITALFFDIGGVLLSNGWEKEMRKHAAEKFGLNVDDLEARHKEVVAAFETGLIDLHEYLDQTVFTQARPFSHEEFVKFMFDQSQPHVETLEVVSKLARSRQYLMATLNNESLELNIHRIEKFHLRDYFTAFFSSCFLGVTKPEGDIYRKALQITQRTPDECVFVDDRDSNLAVARHLGMHTILYQGAEQLRLELSRYGVRVDASRSAANA